MVTNKTNLIDILRLSVKRNLLNILLTVSPELTLRNFSAMREQIELSGFAVI